MKIPKLLLLQILLVAVAQIHADEIEYFDIVRTDTGTRVRRLRDNDVLRFQFPYTFVPRIKNISGTAPVLKITYFSPLRYETTRLPFTLLGASPVQQGRNEIHAIVNDKHPGVRVTFQVASHGYPHYGPTPDAFAPSSYSSASLKSVLPPVVNACNQTVVISESGSYIDRDFHFRHPDQHFYVSAMACPGTEVRFRFLTVIPQRRRRRRTLPTHVITASISTALSASSADPGLIQGRIFPDAADLFLARTRCPRGPIYGEICQRLATHANKIFCVTTPLFPITKEWLKEPLLSYRPPLLLNLAPRDRRVAVRLQTKSSDHVSYITPYGTGEHWGGINQTFSTRLIVQSLSGKILQTSRMVVNKQSVLFLGGASGVSAEYDGAIVYAEYAYSSCPRFRGDLVDVYTTELSVRASNPSLSRQDRALPTFTSPVILPRGDGRKDPVELVVKNVRNPGNGMFADGVSSPVMLQWYRLTYYRPLDRSHPRVVPGETKQLLYIAEIDNLYFSLGHGSFMQTYFVDACNTFGCIRSEGIDLGNLLNDFSYFPPSV